MTTKNPKMKVTTLYLEQDNFELFKGIVESQALRASPVLNKLIEDYNEKHLPAYNEWLVKERVKRKLDSTKLSEKTVKELLPKGEAEKAVNKLG